MMYYLNLFFLIFVVFSTTVSSKECSSLKSNSKLFCYYEKITDVDDCRCTYIILPANSDVKAIERLGKNANGAKFLVTVHEFNEGLVNLLKSNKIDGLEINLRKLDSKNDINDFISTIKSKLDSNLFVALSVPAKTEIIAKYFDFKQLSKNVDAFILQTAFLGASQNVTFHPSRLTGMWDMQNTDSVLDLISGLGAPLQKVIISAPVQGFQFKLQNDEYTAPGSPALELKSITRKELCEKMGNGANWTLERDQDQTGPYIFSNNEWIAFEDPMSIDIKTKYVRVRGLAGLALKDLSQDDKTKCESSLLEAAYEGISKQARAPRGAILHSLEREILERSTRQVQSVKESPFRISRVIDTEGHIHVVRQDTRTEFECSRQGYFVHPRSCNRFYRCVKFDQLVDDYNVFEFDCPEGLVFDEKVEVCVWPGSLPHASACSGSSEIAPVPKQRFVCPSEPGYYADPENCRWFFACLDHGQSSMEAYEFRCPYGLVFDQDKLLCEWPWIVKCGAGFGIIKTDYYGGSTNTIETYDGLGTLHAVSLGGVSGTLQNVPSKIYSNVGFSGSQFAANNALNKDGYLYQNSAEYLNQQSLDAAKRLGLSVKATQSLQNAGLINTVHLNGYNSDINNFQNGQFALNSGVKYTQTPITFGSKISSGNLGFVSTLQENNQNNYDQLKINQLYNENPYLIQNGAYQTSLKESQNLNEYKPKSNYQVKTAGLQAFATKSTLNANQGIQGNINIVAGGTSGVDGIQIYNNGEELSSSTIQGYNTADIKTTYQSTTPIPITGSSVVTSVPLPSISTVKSFEKYNGGVVANIPQLQYSVNPYAGNVFLNSLSNKKYGYGEFNSGNSYNYAAKINSLPYITYKKPDYSVNGYASLNQQNHLSGSAYSYSNKLSQNNQGYVSINSPTTGSTTPTSIYSGVSLSSTPIISSTLKPIVVQQPQVYVSSTPSTFNIGVDNKPAISSYSFTKQDSSLDYTYPKSETKQIYVSTTPASLNIPTQQVFEQQQITLKQGNAGIAYSSDNSGYDYPKPSIKFEEKPQVFSSTAATLVQPIQKVVVQQKSDFGQISSHNFDTKYDFGYNPSIKIESTPQVYVSTPASIPLNPVTVEQQKIVVQQPVKSQTTYSYQAQNNVGYSYPQPSVFVDKKPQVFISSSTITPTVNPVTIEQQKLLVQQPVNSITYTSSNQENNGYSYPKPAIKFEEGPKTFISSTPSTLKLTEETQVYVQPKQSTVYVSSTPATFVQPVKTNVVVQEYAKPAISSYSFTKKESNYGYTYPKPVIPFEEKPKVYVSSTPASVPVKPLVIEQPKVYVKETIKPALTYTYQNQENLGYYYPKPAIKIDQPKVYVSSTPLPIVPKPQVYVQQYKPAVSTYTFNKLINSVGYSYPKPALAFEEKPQITYNVPSQVVYQKPIQPVGVNFYQKPLTIPKPLLVQQPVQELPKLVVQQPQVISTIPFVQQKSSYNYNNQEVKTGYQYTKPINVVEEKIQYQQPILSYKTPVVTYKQVPQVVVQQPQFVSSTPSSNFVEHKVSSYDYNNQEVKTIQYKPLTIVEEKRYQQPVVYEQKPALTYNTQLYNIQQKSEQALNLQKQAESFIGQDIYIPQVTTPQTYVKPVVLQPQGFSKTYVQPVSTYNYKTIVDQTVKTVIPVTTVRPKVIVSSTYSTPVIQQNVEFKGYDYPKPQINFVEESKYVTYNKVPVQEVPIVPKKAYVTYQSTPKPLIVENYSTGTPVVQQKVEVKGYDYPKPQINFAEEPKYVTYENKVPVQVPIVPQKAYVTYQSTPKPIVVEDYSAPTPVVNQNVEFKGYDYPKPQINFVEEPKYVSYENKVPVQEVPIVPKKAYVTYQSTPTPIVVEDYSAPPTQNIRLQNVNENRYYQKQNVLKLQFGKTYFAKTPAPTYQTTLASVVQQKLQPTQEPFYYYDSRLSTTPAQIVNKEIVYTTETPVIEFKSVTRPTIIKTEQPFRQEVYQYDSRLSTTPETVTSRPTIDYSYNVDNLELKKEYIAIEKKPSTYLPPTSTIQVTTEPIYSTYLPPTTETNPPVTYTSRPRVRITTQPSKEYLPVRNRVRITTTEPNLEYLPVRNKARITTTTERVTVPSREYLPTPTVGATIVENYENFNLLKKPAKVIKIVRPVVKTVIKENNFHPLLAAKLGAQCTCVSNTVKLRKEPLRIEVEDDDYVESDNEGTVVDNYEFDSQKDDVVEITPTPLIDLRSSTAKALKNSRGKSRGRFYVVSDKNDVQIVSRKKISPIVVEDDDETSDQDIVRAVKTGLKLVKQAAREGARQGTEEALTGLSREEKLLGVECQRAGLFRHPTQCNKFYSCKWDCTKNQYKLHVFNCPVHLTFDGNLGACNWPSQGPACLENTLLPNDS